MKNQNLKLKERQLKELKIQYFLAVEEIPQGFPEDGRELSDEEYERKKKNLRKQKPILKQKIKNLEQELKNGNK